MPFLQLQPNCAESLGTGDLFVQRKSMQRDKARTGLPTPAKN